MLLFPFETKDSAYNRYLQTAYNKGQVSKDTLDTYKNATVIFTNKHRFPVQKMDFYYTKKKTNTTKHDSKTGKVLSYNGITYVDHYFDNSGERSKAVCA